MPTDPVSIVNTINAVLPNVISLIKAIQGHSNPTEPLPTDAEVLAALNQAVAASVAVDEEWKRQHPQG